MYYGVIIAGSVWFCVYFLCMVGIVLSYNARQATKIIEEILKYHEDRLFVASWIERLNLFINFGVWF